MKSTLAEEIKDQTNRGIVIILTGPTGVGKDTILNKLHEKNPSMVKIITTTTRAMRAGEQEGDPYHFLTREAFEQKIAEKVFFEWVEFRGELYGTQKQTLERALATGNDVIWRIDTRGVKNIKEKVKSTVERVVFIFLTAPLEVLEARVKREEGDVYQKRWNDALVRWEMEQYDDCDYLVFNADGALDQSIEKIIAIIEAKKMEICKPAHTDV